MLIVNFLIFALWIRLEIFVSLPTLIAADHGVFQKDIGHPDCLLSRLPDLQRVVLCPGGQRVDAAAPLGVRVQHPSADAGPDADTGRRLRELGWDNYVPGTQLSLVMKKVLGGFVSYEHHRDRSQFESREDPEAPDFRSHWQCIDRHRRLSAWLWGAGQRGRKRPC